MAAVLGLDLGTNSIGWAIIDSDTNELIDCGSKIYSTKRYNERNKARMLRRLQQRKLRKSQSFSLQKITSSSSPIILALISCILITLLMTIINFKNWQFWFNLSLTTLVSTLALLHQKDKKN